MMFSDVARKPTKLSDTQQVSRQAGILLARKIWLPKLLYAALPYFYVVAGIASLLTTMYISNWLWLLPHYVLFSAACIHLGILIYRRRHA